MRTRNLARLTALATVGAASATLAVSGDAQASGDDCAPGTSSSWTCGVWDSPDDGDKGGTSVGAEMHHPSDGTDYYSVRFEAKGENLIVTDSYPDSKEAVAYLKVEGSGTARFDNHYSKTYPLSFSEGKRVWIKVGIEGTDNWTDWSPAGRT